MIVHFGYLIDECFPNDSCVSEHRSLTEFQGDSTQGSSESRSLVTTSSNHFRTEGYKGLGGGWKARWPRVIIHYLVSSSSNSSRAKITAEHDKGSRSSRVNMVAEHAISRALYLGSAAPHFPPIVHFADFEGCATHEEYFEIESLLL